MIQAIPEVAAIELVHPMPGFLDRTRFTLAQLDDTGVLGELRSLEDPQLRFLVMQPDRFFPDYAPEVSDDVVADLSSASVEDLMVLVVVNAGESLEQTTANLMAPVIVDIATQRGCQMLLDDPNLPIAAPLT